MADKNKTGRTALLVLLLVVVFLAATNPGLPEFRNWFELQAASAVKEKAGGGIGELFGAIAKGAAGLAVDSDYRRSELGLASLYQSRNSKGEVIHSYLGIARTFIKLR
jgi:hypothetical protein